MEDKELRVRLPAELRDQLERFAADTHRSLTGATITLLAEALLSHHAGALTAEAKVAATDTDINYR